MKKLFKCISLIAAMALTCAFFGCSDGNSSDEISSVGNSSADESNDQSNGNSSDDESKDQSNESSSDDNNSSQGSSSSGSFDDCTIAATEVTLADGSWTIKTVSDDKGKGQYSEDNIKATKSGDTLTFKSCSRKNTIDLSKMMSAEKLTNFNNLTDEQKKQQVRSGMGLPDDVTITFNGNICTVTGALTEPALNEYKTKLSRFISSANEIKTNSDKTKYAITKEFDNEAPVKIYINKD